MSRRRWLFLSAAAAVLAIVAVTDPAPTERRYREVRYDFLGVVESADVDRWETSTTTAFDGGPSSPLRVGPGRLILSDGTHLQVPPDTPGANTCAQLPPRSYRAGCVIAGEFGEEGPPTVAWFGVVERVDDVDDRVAHVRLHRLRDGQGLVFTGWLDLMAFPLADEISFVRCHDAPPTVAAREAELPSAAVHTAHLDVATERIVRIDCAYAE